MTTECIFCAIVRHEAEASLVYQDETVIAFMDRYPCTPGHLLVVPRRHVVRLEDLDAATGGHVWAVANDLARTLRRSAFRPEGMNLVLYDGEASGQTVFHVHLHVVPRYTGDAWRFNPTTLNRDRAQLDDDAGKIRESLTASARPLP
jgi:histidine triad (HIT) family protein